MTGDTVLTDELLGQAIADAVRADVGAAPATDGQALLVAVRSAARTRSRHRRRTATATVAGLAVAASVAWGLFGPGGFDLRGSGPVPPARSSTVPEQQRASGTLAPGQVVGASPAPLLSQGPYAAVPPIPAGVQWGATASQLRAAYDSKGLDLVAFPFPASAVLQPTDLGAQRVDVDLSAVQSTVLFPALGTFSCTGGYDPGWQDVVAGLRIGVWPATAAEEPVPGAPLPTAPSPSADAVSETLAAFQADGAHQLVRGAANLVRCAGAHTGVFRQAELLPTAGLPGDEAFAALSGPEGVDQPRTRDYLGLARVGQVTVSVDITAADSATARTELVARGTRLLTAAVARVATPEVQGLVARYVR